MEKHNVPKGDRKPDDWRGAYFQASGLRSRSSGIWSRRSGAGSGPAPSVIDSAIYDRSSHLPRWRVAGIIHSALHAVLNAVIPSGIRHLPSIQSSIPQQLCRDAVPTLPVSSGLRSPFGITPSANRLPPPASTLPKQKTPANRGLVRACNPKITWLPASYRPCRLRPCPCPYRPCRPCPYPWRGLLRGP